MEFGIPPEKIGDNDNDNDNDKKTPALDESLETGTSQPYRPTRFQSAITILSCVRPQANWLINQHAQLTTETVPRQLQ